MRKLIYFLIALATLSCVFAGCEKDSYLEENSRESAKSRNPYRVTLKEALASADVLLTRLDGGKTRSHRRVKTVEYYTGADAKTRSAVSDTLLYIVNYDNDEGFAILGADSRMCPIYAISNEGRLDMSDTLYNKGLAQCLAGIRTSTPWSPGGSVWRDTTKNLPPIVPPVVDPINPGFGDREITIFENIKPMIPKNPSRWTQGENFNAYCPIIGPTSYDRGVVGCAPLACAQIMSYYKWPQSYEGIALSWDDINAYEVQHIVQTYGDAFKEEYYTCPSELAKFLAYVGKTVNAQYGRNQNFNPETSVNNPEIRDNFYKFGYAALSNPVPFSYSTVPADLKNGPILVSGWKDNILWKNGHTWIVDGYISYKETWDAIDNDDQTLYYSLYHCVWGWGGCNNGYFKWDSSRGMTTIPYATSEAPADNSERIDTTYVFGYMNYYRNFRPNK